MNLGSGAVALPGGDQQVLAQVVRAEVQAALSQLNTAVIGVDVGLSNTLSDRAILLMAKDFHLLDNTPAEAACDRALAFLDTFCARVDVWSEAKKAAAEAVV